MLDVLKRFVYYVNSDYFFKTHQAAKRTLYPLGIANVRFDKNQYYTDSCDILSFRRNIMIVATEASSGLLGTGSMIIWLVVLFGLMYFLMIRPQKKEQKRVGAMISDLAVGDAVVTTGGFYGVVIDITEEDVIVEFGNNKNCRIPMRKSAIAEVEKAEEIQNS